MTSVFKINNREINLTSKCFETTHNTRNNCISIANDSSQRPQIDSIIRKFSTSSQSSEECIAKILSNVIKQFIQLTEKIFDKLTQALESSESAKTVNTVSTEKRNSQPTNRSNTASTTSIGNSGQFLWKPKSDKDGKLAILIPANLSHNIKSVAILDPKNKKNIETGKDGGIGNGERAHFRFKKAGGNYPDNAIVEITYNNGNKKRIKIPETSSRYSK